MLGFPLLLASLATAWIAAGAMLGGAAGRRGWDAAVPRIGAAAGGFAVLLLVAPLLHRDPVAPRGGERELHAEPDTP